MTEKYVVDPVPSLLEGKDGKIRGYINPKDDDKFEMYRRKHQNDYHDTALRRQGAGRGRNRSALSFLLFLTLSFCFFFLLLFFFIHISFFLCPTPIHSLFVIFSSPSLPSGDRSTGEEKTHDEIKAYLRERRRQNEKKKLLTTNTSSGSGNSSVSLNGINGKVMISFERGKSTKVKGRGIFLWISIYIIVFLLRIPPTPISLSLFPVPTLISLSLTHSHRLFFISGSQQTLFVLLFLLLR